MIFGFVPGFLVPFSLELKDCTIFAADDHSILYVISYRFLLNNLIWPFSFMKCPNKTVVKLSLGNFDLFVMKECLLVIVYKNQQSRLIHLDLGYK